MRRALAAALVRRRGFGFAPAADCSSSLIAAAACSLPTALPVSSCPPRRLSDDATNTRRFSSEATATARFGASSKAKAAAAAAKAAAAAAASTPTASSSLSSKPSELAGFVPAADLPEGSQASDTNVYLHEVSQKFPKSSLARRRSEFFLCLGKTWGAAEGSLSLFSSFLRSTSTSQKKKKTFTTGPRRARLPGALPQAPPHATAGDPRRARDLHGRRRGRCLFLLQVRERWREEVREETFSFFLVERGGERCSHVKKKKKKTRAGSSTTTVAGPSRAASASPRAPRWTRPARSRRS